MTTSRGNSAADLSEGLMAHAFALGSLVVNFGTTAKVVGVFAAADGAVVAETGWPILRQVGASGRLRGGKWLADPSKCAAVEAVAR